MKKIFFLLLFAFCAVLCGAQEPLECSFTQARTIQASGKVIRSAGVVSFKAPDQLTMTYTDPAGEYLVISGPMLRSNTQGRGQYSMEPHSFKEVPKYIAESIMNNRNKG